MKNHTLPLRTLPAIATLSLLIAYPAASQHRRSDHQTPAPEPAAAPAPSRNYQKYATALSWNDNQVAKNALYDMILDNPGVDSLVFSLAYLYYEGQEYASAALVCQDLLTHSPKNINYLSISAASLEALGAREKALENYETIYLQNSDIGALYKATLLQYQMDRSAECLANIGILLGRPESKTTMVGFTNEQGQHKEYPMQTAAINLKGLLYEKKKETNKAKKAYQEALGLSPDFFPAKDRLDKLEKDDKE